MNLDPDNPFAALLAQSSGEPTILDRRSKGAQKAKPVPEDEEAPITLSVRQPSFSSLRGELILKGGELAADLPEIKDETSDPILVASKDNKSKVTKHSICQHQEEEETDPQVIVVKQLQEQNKNRWKQMGYEPQEDVIPLVRARSQAIINADVNPPPMPYKPPAMPVLEESEPVPVKSHRQRSNSFGKKGNDNTMPLAISPENESDSESFIEEEEEEEDFAKNESSNLETPASTSQKEEETVGLFGHLSQIVTEPPTHQLYKILATGFVGELWNPWEIRDRLRVYNEICTKNKWTEESDYISEVLERMDDNELLLILRHALDDTKLAYYARISAIRDDCSIQLSQITADYFTEADILDNKYQSPETAARFMQPSPELIQLKKQMKTAADAKKVGQLEMKAAIEARMKMKEAYYQEDRSLKEKFAAKRLTVLQKRDAKISAMKLERDAKIRSIERKLRSLQELGEPSDIEFEGENLVIYPELIHREMDLDILRQMNHE